MSHFRAIVCKIKRPEDGSNESPTLINKLCPDILSAIFLIIADNADWAYQNYVPQVSHVCAHWRFIAIDTPHLWSRLTIRLSTGFNCSRISEWQRRARSLPFSVNLSQENSLLSWPTVPITAEPIHQAFPDLRRIESFQVEGDKEFLHGVFRPYVDVPNPYIRHLTISHWQPSNGQLDPPLKLFCHDMPHLETLRLNSYDLSDWNAISSFQSLKRLWICQPASTPLHIFSALPRLEELDVEISYSLKPLFSLVQSTSTMHKEAHFRSLLKLSLHFPSPSLAAEMLGLISLPSCKSLNIGVTCGHVPIRIIEDLFSSLSCLLTTKTIFSRLPIHCLCVSPSEIVARAWDDCQNLKIADDHTRPSVKSFLVVDQSTAFRLRFYGPARRVAAPKSLLAKIIIHPLLGLFDLQHLRFLSWEHFDATFTRAKLELGDSFFASAPELRKVEVRTAFSGFVDGMLPRMESILLVQHSHGEGLHLDDSEFVLIPLNLDSTLPMIYYEAPPESSTPFQSDSLIACPTLSNITIILPERYRRAEDNQVQGVLKELATKLERRRVVLGRRLETLVVNGRTSFQAVTLSHSVFSRLQEVAQHINIRSG
ncbi:hypothetical protein AX16_004805 [Volvariella volvacea WC 439]|nr:hypothetical protein AX16_004805 [Volvariella volvacea WC 439]